MIYRELPTCDHPDVDLRPITAADLDQWSAYLSLPAVHEHTSWDATSAGELAGYASGDAERTADSMLRLAIVSRASGRLAGTVGFHSVRWQDRRAEIAYDLAPDFWHRGIASHVVTLMVRWAHDDVGFNRVQATVLQSNAPSQSVLERCNFKFEGMLRRYRMVRGQPGDFALYSHLASVD